MWTNFHNHSKYCDGYNNVEDYVQEAIRLGMPVLGFSGHAPVPWGTEWNMTDANLENYISDVLAAKEKYKREIEVYMGLEIDFMLKPDTHTPRYFLEKGIEYLIGSIHFTGVFSNGIPCEMDGPHDLFLKGLNEIFGGDIKAMVREYYRLTREMLNNYDFQVLGHLDKIKMQNHDEKFWKEDETWYKNEILNVLEKAKEKNVIVEINTRGQYKKATTEFYPSSWILETIREMEIPVMLNSDSHKPEELTGYFGEAASHLKKIGFKKLWALKNNKWQEFEFDEQGLKI